jgi:hypothetical protein
MEPAVAKVMRIRLTGVPVTAEDGGAAHRHFPWLTACDLLPVLVGELEEMQRVRRFREADGRSPIAKRVPAKGSIPVSVEPKVFQ